MLEWAIRVAEEVEDINRTYLQLEEWNFACEWRWYPFLSSSLLMWKPSALKLAWASE